MEYKRFNNDIIVRIDKGEEIITELRNVAVKENILLASVNGLGATNDFTVGVYDLDKKAFCPNHFTGTYEIVSLVGTIDTMDGTHYSHIHMSAGDTSGHVVGGHLKEAYISATGEIVLHVIDGQINRKKDLDTGLNLFDFTSNY